MKCIFVWMMGMAVVWSLLLCGFATPVAAQSVSDIAELDEASKTKLETFLKRGSDAYEAGDDSVALHYFERALELVELASLQYRRGQCLARLQRHAEAINAYQRYLELSPDAADVGRIESEIRRLKRTLANNQARIKVVTAPTSASVYVDDPSGRLLGKTPLDIELEPGTYTLYIALDGHYPTTWEVQAVKGKNETFEVAFEPLQTNVGVVVVEGEEAPSPWSYWLFGMGGATAVGSGVLAWLASSKVDEANKFARDNPNHTRRELEAIQESVPVLENWSIVAGITSGALLTAGAVVFFYPNSEKPPADETSVSIVPTQNGVQLYMPF